MRINPYICNMEIDEKIDAKKAVSMLTVSRAQKILVVSRRNDHNDFGLIGGKKDDSDSSLESAAAREFTEETGLTNFRIGREVFNKFTGEFHDVTFLTHLETDVFDMRSANKKLIEAGEGIMAWKDWDTLYQGTFGEYNRQINKTWYEINRLEQDRMYYNRLTDELFYVHDIVKFGGKMFYTIVHEMLDEPMMVRATALRALDLVRGPLVDDLSFDATITLWTCSNIFGNKLERTFFHAPFHVRKAAIAAHLTTNHYYDNTHHLYPYHLGRVVNAFHRFEHLVPVEDREYVESGLWYHDGPEDARLTFNDVKKLTNKNVATFALRLTNNRGENRAERANPEYYAGIRDWLHGPLGKACDRVANVEESIAGGNVSMYRKENSKFEDSLRTPSDGLDEIFDYTRKIVEY